MQQTNNTYPFYGPEDIKRYLSGSMNAQEMHDMEKAALKDPLLADAIDGFREADPAVTDAHLNDLKASILGLSKEAPAVIPINAPAKTGWWRWVVAACSLGLIAGSIWWFTQRSESNINEPLAKAELKALADSAQSASAPTQATTANETVANTAVTEKHGETVLKNVQEEAKLATKAADPLVAAAPQNPEPAQKTASELRDVQPQAQFHFDFNTEKAKTVDEAGVSSVMRKAVASNAAIPTPQNDQELLVQKPASAQPVVYIQGKVVDKEGAPLPYTTISAPGNRATTTQNDGSFVLPLYDSTFNVSINRVGYDNAIARLTPGTQNKIILNRATTHLDETVIVGHDSRKKSPVTLAEAKRFRAMATNTSSKEIIYPEEGWAHFYEELGSSLGVDRSKTTKTLQIKFTVDENGDPVDFEIVESPDALLARKAIEFIKKAKWKNFKLDKNALVKIEVN